ncbi:MAG: hypothetical protein ABEJ08_02545 [Halobacteriaceae archaeon]
MSRNATAGGSAAGSNSFRTDFDFTTLGVVAGVTAVLFAGGLSLIGFYEIPPDIDFKPFFIVYAIIFFVPWGTPTIASAVGASAAEGLLDLIEGAGPDDPFGWVGYVVGFTVFGWMIKDAEADDWLRLGVASVVGGFLQIAIEGIAFLVVAGDSVSFYATVVSANTVTHGVVMGAVLLPPTLQALRGRVEEAFGAAMGGSTSTA